MPSTPQPRVLFLAPVEPWSRENGSSVIIADLLEGLLAVGGAQVLPIFLRTPPPGYSPRPPAGIDGIQMHLEGVPRWVSLAKALALGSSPMRHRFANGKVTRFLRETIAARGFAPTVIHVEHLPLVDIALGLAKAYRCPVVYRSHNIEAVLLARRAGIPGPLGKLLVRLSERAEAKATRECRETLCISEVDLAWVRARVPGARASVLPCSLLMSRYDLITTAPDPAVAQMAFVGGLDWAPNEAGLRWFVDHCLPRIVAKVPRARLAVLARGAAQRQWLTENPAVDLVAPEQNALGLFSTSNLSLAPLLQGGGVRIKIPESLAVGCPVVATTIGAEGHDLPGIMRADDPGTFANACADILDRPHAAHPRAGLREAVEARHGATVLASRLVGFWSSLR